MEKNAADNNEFKNLIKKKLSWGKRKEILYEKIIILKKENWCLKSEVKNQESVIKMLLTRDKYGNEWKVGKTHKIQTNINKLFATSMPSKVLLVVNLQNRFSSVMVTEGIVLNMYHKFKHQLTIVSVLKFKTQNLNRR